MKYKIVSLKMSAKQNIENKYKVNRLKFLILK